MADKLPPLPPGFMVDQAEEIPALPPGFTLDAPPSESPVSSSLPSPLSRFGELWAERNQQQSGNLWEIGKALTTRFPMVSAMARDRHPLPGSNVVEKGLNLLRAIPQVAALETIAAPVGAAIQTGAETLGGVPRESSRDVANLLEMATMGPMGFMRSGGGAIAKGLQALGIGRPSKAVEAEALQAAIQRALPSKGFPEIPLTTGERLAGEYPEGFPSDLSALLPQPTGRVKVKKPTAPWNRLSDKVSPPVEGLENQSAKDLIATLSRATNPTIEEVAAKNAALNLPTRKALPAKMPVATATGAGHTPIPPELQAVSEGKAPAFLVPPAVEGTMPTVGEQALAGQDLPAVARRLKLSLFTGEDGTKVFYRAKTVPRATLTALDKEGRLADIVNGPGTSPKPDAPTTAVTAKTPEGTEVRTILTDTPETTASAVTAQPEGMSVEVKPAIEGATEAVQSRMQGAEPLTPPLGDSENIVELGMGLPIPKSMKDRLRQFYGPEGQEQGLKAKGWHTATTIFNRVLGRDAQGVPFGELYQQILKEQDIGKGRGDLILQPLKLHELTDAENLAVKQVLNEGRRVPLTARAKQAVEAFDAYRKESAQTATTRGVEVRRDVTTTTKGGETITRTSWKPFEAIEHYYPNSPDWRKIATVDPAQFRRLMIRDHRDLPIGTINELVDGYIAQAKGQPIPKHVSDDVSRLIRGGEPSSAFLHERRFSLPSELLADLADVFPRYIEDTAREFAIAKVAGPRGKLFEDAIQQAKRSGNKDVQLAMQQWDDLTRRNVVDQASQDVGRGSRILGNLATAMFLGPTTAVKQLSQTAMAAAELPIRSFVKGVGKALTKEGWRDAKQFGATIDAVWQDMQMQKRFGEALHPAAGIGEKIEHGTQRLASAVVKTSGVTFMDSFGRVLAYNGALDDFTRAMQQAKQGNQKAIDYLATRRLTIKSDMDAIKTAASRVSDEINLRADPSTVPVFLYKPGFQSAMRHLNSFNYAMTNKLLRNYVTPLGRAVAKGDVNAVGSELLKISKFAAAMGIGGEIIGDTVRQIQGRRTDRPGGAPEDFARDLIDGKVPMKVFRNRVLTNMADAGTFGFLQVVKESMLATGGPREAAGRMANTVVGAGISNALEIGGHVANLAANVGDTEPGPRGGKSGWQRAKGEALRAVGRRVPVVGSVVAGQGPRSQSSDRRIAEAEAVRARLRGDRSAEREALQGYRQRQGERISPQALRKAMREYGQ